MGGRAWLGMGVVVLMGIMGCAPARPAVLPALGNPRSAPRTLVVPRVVVTPTEATTVEELFQRAQRALEAGKPAEALRDFDRVVAAEPEGLWAAMSLLQGSGAEEQLGQRERAVFRLKQLVRRFPERPPAREALVRLVRLEAFLEHWTSAGEAAGLLLSRYADLAPLDTLVALSGKALALLDAGDTEGASHLVEKARGMVELHQLDAAGPISRDLAQLYFALGEIRRIKSTQIRLRPVTPEFPTLLEQRCQLLLDAQTAYSDTMRAYDAHWSAMAGYRVGELYHELHKELMAVESPASPVTEGDRLLFEGAMRYRYAVLLEKALVMMNHTLSMSRRTGEKSSWVTRSEDAKRAIETAIREENAVLDRLPYTRDQLGAALTTLAARYSKAAKGGRPAPGPLPRDPKPVN